MERLLEPLACAHAVRIGRSDPAGQAFARLHALFDRALEGFAAGFPAQGPDRHFDEDLWSDRLTRRQCALFDEAVEFNR
jgi:hypothetical protein